MIEAISGISAAFGLATSAGLNADIPGNWVVLSKMCRFHGGVAWLIPILAVTAVLALNCLIGRIMNAVSAESTGWAHRYPGPFAHHRNDGR